MRPADATRASQRSGSPRVAWSLAALASACSDPLAVPIATHRAELVYGADNRRDVYATESELFRGLALESAVALIAESSLERRSDGRHEIVSEALGDFANLCASEAFREQPSAAMCSGVLVDDTLVLTAAHCATNVASCDDQRWLFGYALHAADALPVVVEYDDVYRCRSVAVSTKGTSADGRYWDYALIELDRPVSRPRRPATLSIAALAEGDAMTVIGYPNGLPAKVASGAVVLDERAERRDYFTLNSDTFDGSSGSGVFDERGELTGVFVRGSDDYEYRPDGECFAVRHIEEVPASPHGEHAGYWAPAVAQWCASGAQSPLCSFAKSSCSANGVRPCAPLGTESAANAGCTFAARSGTPPAWPWSLVFAAPCALLAVRRSRQRCVRKSDERCARSTLAT